MKVKLVITPTGGYPPALPVPATQVSVDAEPGVERWGAQASPSRLAASTLLPSRNLQCLIERVTHQRVTLHKAHKGGCEQLLEYIKAEI